MRAPHYFIHGNLVFGEGPDDPWAAYKLEGTSFPGLSLSKKIELKERVELFAYAIESDFQIMRVSREWSPEGYVERALTTLDRRHGHADAFRSYLDEHRRQLAGRRVVRPDTYLFVRLAGAAGSGLLERMSELSRAIERRLGISDARAISNARLEELRRAEDRCFRRVDDYLPCERARSGEIAGLIRSSYARGIGALPVAEEWAAQALWVDPIGEGEDASPAFEPYTHDLMRLHESRVEILPRELEVHSELGVSHQAMLVCGALPDHASFPGSDIELLFTPLEAGFPVDLSFSCEYVSNKAAQKIAQKRMVDADQQAIEEGHGTHGPSVKTDEKTYASRELQARLGSSDRPPLLRSALCLAVGAESSEQLEERIDALRTEFGRTELHRPLGEQHRLFLGAMPAQRFPVPDYKAHLLPEQLGAMVPTAISHAGSEIGPYLGYTLTGSHQPVQFDLAEACRTSRPPTLLLTGSLGSGKTIAVETLLYQAFLQGSTPIVDIDPKGDHTFHRLPAVAAATEEIDLGPDEKYRGLLDPMRIGSDERRADLTNNYLTSILPTPVKSEWLTEIKSAIGIVDARGGRTTGEVVDELERGNADAAAAGRALRVHLDAGLAKLGYARPDLEIPEPGGKQVISLRIRNLTLPRAGTSRDQHQEDERVSAAVLRLVAAYALRLCAASTRAHSVLALDEAWALLGDSQGQQLMDQFTRMGRSMNITPILASQIVGDADALEALVGGYFAFGVETEREAEAALKLLRLDADDAALQARLVGFRAGRCYLRDFEGRVVPMRVDPGEELLAALDTTPRRAEGEETGDAVPA
jgi:hypothetical protein